MAIIDSQVHAYEANTAKRPWHSVPNWPPHVTGDEMVAAMDKVGVDGAIFISSFSMYRYDASYAVDVARAHPGRLAIVRSDANEAERLSREHISKAAGKFVRHLQPRGDGRPQPRRRLSSGKLLA